MAYNFKREQIPVLYRCFKYNYLQYMSTAEKPRYLVFLD